MTGISFTTAPGPTEDMVSVGNTGIWMVHIHYDGSLEIEGDIDDAAALFWETVSSYVKDQWTMAVQAAASS